MRRIVFAAFAILIGTAGIRAYSPPQVTRQHTRIAFLFSVHNPVLTAGADSALRRAWAFQPDAVVMIDDVGAIQLGGYETADSLVDAYRTKIQARSMIPAYGAVDNWDLSTSSAGSAGAFAFTAADSADPLRYMRQVIPQMDWYGNYVQDIGNTRLFFLNSNFTNATDSCESQRRKFDPKTGHGTGFYAAGNQDRAYMPASMYSNWNSVTGPGYIAFKSAAQSCTLPHFILVAPKGFYPVQGDTTASGVWCWNRAKVFMALLDTVTTAAGHHVDAVMSGHQHCYWHICARHDSSIAYASGGIDHINGPPCGASHAPTIGAQLYTGNISPDTAHYAAVPTALNGDSLDLVQNHGGVGGSLLVAMTGTSVGSSQSAKFSRFFPRPAWMIYDASFTSGTWTTYDSSSVKDQWTRVVR